MVSAGTGSRFASINIEQSVNERGIEMRSSFSKKKQGTLSDAELELQKGIDIIQNHSILRALPNKIEIVKHKNTSIMAKTNSEGEIFVNLNAGLYASEWAYVIVHCALHHVFGHFEKENLPDTVSFDKALWNQACDIYVAKFLAELKFGQAVVSIPECFLTGNIVTEVQIYQKLLDSHADSSIQPYGMASSYQMDMDGLDNPIVYKPRSYGKNPYRSIFHNAIYWGVTDAVLSAGGVKERVHSVSFIKRAAKWFLDCYPLLGGLAASFQVIEDNEYCRNNQIQVAAVDTAKRVIYANPSAGLSEAQWRFVLAHEYLHAGLCHARRCQDRDFPIWNIACDFVINSWLVEMQIGEMPSMGLLYDPELRNQSAESIYDRLIENLRKSRKLATFRGYGLGDMIYPEENLPYGSDYTTFDDVCKEALALGLDYHLEEKRGYLPAGLVEEIRALSMPPIPWEVKLAYWFQEMIPIPEKKRNYARPSRRQGATPDIPRPSYVIPEEWQNTHTFGVIIDTSASMSSELLGKALGAVASYAAAREVRYVRVVFCDAAAYDGGYMTVEELANKVEVKGRGGTRLQPAVDLLEHVKDFPIDAPVLVITDGMTESHIKIKRKHAWLLPEGKRLPFQTNASVFWCK